MRHTPANTISTPEAGRRFRQFAAGQRPAYSRAADPGVAVRNGIEILDAETELFSRAEQGRITASPVFAEFEVVADQQVLHPQSAHDQAIDKIGRAHPSHGRVEFKQHYAIDAAILDRTQLFP